MVHGLRIPEPGQGRKVGTGARTVMVNVAPSRSLHRLHSLTGRGSLTMIQPEQRKVEVAKLKYLAAGKMVVASLIPELKQYESVAKVSEDADQFVKNVDEAIAEGRSPSKVARCVETAREKTWDARVEMTSAVIAETLAARAAARRPTEALLPNKQSV